MYAEPIAGSTLVAASDVVTTIRPNPRGPHVAGGGTRRREDPVEVDVDHAVPALVGVALERALLDSRALAACPGADEADAWIDAGVRERDVEPAVRLRRLVDRAVEGGVIRHVGDDAPHVEPFACSRDACAATASASTSISVTRAPCAASTSPYASPSPLAPPVTMAPKPADVETRGNVHVQLPPVISLAAEPIAHAPL